MSESIWDDPRITAYVLGEMSQSERETFETEIESNRELAAAVEEAQVVTEQLSSLYGEESVPRLDQQRRASIVADRERPRAAAQSGSWLRLGLVLATAAVVLLMIGIAPMMKARKTNDGLALQREKALVSQEEASRALREQAATLPQELSERDRSLELSFDEASTESVAIVAERLAEARESDEMRQETLSRSSGRRRQAVSEEVVKSLPASDPLMVQGASGSQGGARGRSDLSRSPGGTERARGVTILQTSPAPSAAPASSPVDGLAAGNQPYDFGLSTAGGDAGPAPAAGAVPAGPNSATYEFVPEPGKQVSSPELKTLEPYGDSLQRQAGQAAPRASALSKQPAAQKAKAGATVRFAESEARFSRQQQVASSDKSRLLGLEEQLARGEGMQMQMQMGMGMGMGGAEYGQPIDEGRGPGIAGDRFEPITDNPFQRVSEHPLSTFSVDVDTASYSKVRDYLMRANQLPRPDAVRIEELVNYFSYDYEPPDDDAEHPFAARVSVTSCPWNEQHRLARIALKGKDMQPEERPRCNLVFLLDTSGSMNAPNKLPLVVEGMKMLLGQLNEEDQVAITVYAGSAGLVLDSTPAKKEKKIRKALTQLSAGGSTNGGAGIALAYQTARDHFIPEGVNRVILCTDGDFNVGTTGTDELVRMVEKEAKGGVFLSVLGFGMGNHNDAMLEQISGRGNGNYAFIDNRQEARKVLVEQTSGTLVTIAKDVKLQIEFNPAQVSSYRLIGYENRILAKEDFNDDKKDAGEIGAGHAVTALYEIAPTGVEADAIGPKVDDLKYQRPAEPSEAADSEELMTLKLRYKQPDGDTSTLVEFPVVDDGLEFAKADDDVRFAAAVASFGMQLRRSPYVGSWTLSDAMNTANRAKGEDRSGLRAEFVTLVQKASLLMGEE